MALSDFRAAVLEDSRYKRYLGLYETATHSINVPALTSELKTIAKIRVEALKKKMAPRRLLDLSMEEVSHRARITEILVSVKSTKSTLSDVGTQVWIFCAAEYSSHLSDIRTKADRDAAVSSCFRKGDELIAKLESLVDMCSDLLKDIDQNSFSLNRVSGMYEILLRPERLHNVDI